MSELCFASLRSRLLCCYCTYSLLTIFFFSPLLAPVFSVTALPICCCCCLCCSSSCLCCPISCDSNSSCTPASITIGIELSILLVTKLRGGSGLTPLLRARLHTHRYERANMHPLRLNFLLHLISLLLPYLINLRDDIRLGLCGGFGGSLLINTPLGFG